ncbi:MAG: hypothetical protein K8R37_04495, partial [Bacteroidales bacterium]|nr:hypothetical protein [Bacteroidales bacterium]
LSSLYDISKAFFNLSGFLAHRPVLNLKGFGDANLSSRSKPVRLGLERLKSSQAFNDISKAFFNLSGFLTPQAGAQPERFWWRQTFQVEESLCGWNLKG